MPGTKEQRSLFGEILDWMLAPLLLLWPMSVALTWLVAQNIANKPFDRDLGEMTRVLSKQVVLRQSPEGARGAAFTLPTGATELLHADEADDIYYQVLGLRGELLSGERSLPLPPDDEPVVADEVRFRDGEMNERRPAHRLCVGGAARPQRRSAAGPGPGGRDAGQALAPGHRDHQGRDPAAVRHPAAGGAAGVAGAGARHRAAQRAAAAHPTTRQQRPSPIDAREAPEEVSPLVRAINDLLARLDRRSARRSASRRRRAPAEDAAGRAAHAGRAGQREIDAGASRRR